MKRLFPTFLLALLSLGAGFAQSPYASSSDFAKYAMKLRENAILTIEPTVVVPTTSRGGTVSGRYAWKTGIVTTIFWVGEHATANNPVPNHASSWDPDWASNFGGYDNPEPSSRRDFIPVGFVPRQNPFYVALPYNDVTHGTTKTEAHSVIPWFRETFVREGQSVCRDRWIAIRKDRKICFAQWSDCGPFRTDHWEYVFGSDRPKPNLNGGAGLDISPAVRDYLGMSGTDTTDWKFVDARDVPSGPWARFGENNDVAKRMSRGGSPVVSNRPAVKGSGSNSGGPTVITR